MATVWGDDSRFVSSYLSAFDGYYLTGDSGYLDEDGYVFVMGRTDDVINVAGHRLSTGVIEAVIASHPAVTETAVIGVHDDTKGQSPRALVVLGDSAEAAAPGDTVIAYAVLARKEIGPVAASNRSTSSLPCRRPGRGRSCARRCARSPTESTLQQCPQRSRTGPCSTTWSPPPRMSTPEHSVCGRAPWARLGAPVTGGGFDTTGRFGSPRGWGRGTLPRKTRLAPRPLRRSGPGTVLVAAPCIRVRTRQRPIGRSASTPSAATTVAPVAPAAMLSAVCAWATVVMTAMRLGPAFIDDALVPPVV